MTIQPTGGIDRLPDGEPRLRRIVDRLRAIIENFEIWPRTLETLVTEVGNTAGVATALFSTVIPALFLRNDSDAIEFIAAGVFAATASTDKRILVTFGSTTLYDSGSLAATSTSWTLRGTIVRTSSTAQKCIIAINSASSTIAGLSRYATATEPLTSAVALSVLGSGTNASDVAGRLWIVRKIPGP